MTFESSVSETVRERLEEQEPPQEKKEELRQEHIGHLVRSTTSRLSVDTPEIGPGLEVDTEAEIPDIYFFTCEE